MLLLLIHLLEEYLIINHKSIIIMRSIRGPRIRISTTTAPLYEAIRSRSSRTLTIALRLYNLQLLLTQVLLLLQYVESALQLLAFSLRVLHLSLLRLQDIREQGDDLHGWLDLARACLLIEELLIHLIGETEVLHQTWLT